MRHLELIVGILGFIVLLTWLYIMGAVSYGINMDLIS